MTLRDLRVERQHRQACQPLPQPAFAHDLASGRRCTFHAMPQLRDRNRREIKCLAAVSGEEILQGEATTLVCDEDRRIEDPSQGGATGGRFRVFRASATSRAKLSASSVGSRVRLAQTAASSAPVFAPPADASGTISATGRPASVNTACSPRLNMRRITAGRSRAASSTVKVILYLPLSV